jgi:hypothetical protein
LILATTPKSTCLCANSLADWRSISGLAVRLTLAASQVKSLQARDSFSLHVWAAAYDKWVIFEAWTNAKRKGPKHAI